MKIIFLDFDGVMDTAYYDHVLSKEGLPGNDSFGTVFDPNCVRNLNEIIEKTGADIVVSSSWKSFMTYKDFLDMWEYRGLPGFVTDVTPTPSIRRNRGDEIDAWLDGKEVYRGSGFINLEELNHVIHQYVETYGIQE